MQKRIGACLGVLVAATIHLALGVRSARACSPIIGPLLGEPCIAIDLIKPASSFPLNLADELRVAQRSFDGYASTQTKTFELSAPLTIARQSDSGYVEVAFELVTEPTLAPGVRGVRLMDPLPGDYIVTSVDDTCSLMQSPIGEGALLGSFSLTEAAAVPTALGTAAWEGQERSTRDYSLGGGTGIGADCTVQTSPGPTGQAVYARNTVRVTLADEVLPWTGVLQASIEVDGKPYTGAGPAFGPAGSDTRSELVVTIDHLCSADDSAYLDSHSNSLTEGEHTLKFIGRIRDFAPFESNEVTFDIDCSAVGACSAAPGPRSTGNGQAWWALGAALLLRRTRRALRPR